MELRRIVDAARRTVELGLACHAGHGLTFANVGPIAAVLQEELNIGHFIVGEAVFSGLDSVIAQMRVLIAAAWRTKGAGG